MRKIAFLLFILWVLGLHASNLSVGSAESKDAVPLKDAVILIDDDDDCLVGKVAGMFSQDMSMVTGLKPEIVGRPSGKGTYIVFGTTQSRHIKKLRSMGVIDTSPIAGGTERFIIKSLEHPVKDFGRVVVIAGSDPRGAAYGLLTLSEKMGVSPWYWWADVPVDKKDNVYVSADYISVQPSVRYRGIFINDEDWGLYQWSAKNYETELGNIGPKTYTKVCELLLRLKCNMLAPAMHACTAAFYTLPENKKIADEYGIMITTSHCEPLLFNNCSRDEWDSAKDGEWNYAVNRQAIYDKLDARVKEAAQYENIYTMGLRGLHDEGMRGNLSLDQRVSLLGEVIEDQRGILSRYIDRPIDSIPQILVPYKEVQEIYEHGLKVPDNITLVWPDDNYGYMKMLSNPVEQTRKGRAGVYYHVSYLGVPHDYLWISTTPPMLMYEEMKKAYDTGADRYWLLNVGDIKPMELSMQFFFDMAWDFSQFDYNNVNDYQARFLSGIFGKRYESHFQWILDNYYRLAWSRKPESMGWEREWDSPEYTGLRDTEFSFDNYNDAQTRLADYTAISDLTDRIYNQLPDSEKPAFFEMLGYPVMASCQMNRKFLMAQLNHELFEKGERAEANWAAAQSKAAYDSIDALTDRFNGLLGGKWHHMMTVPPAICALYQNMPDLNVTPGVKPVPVDLTPAEEKYALEGCMYVPVNSFTKIVTDDTHTVRKIKGLGYDWEVLQLGEATQPSSDPTSLDRGFGVTYDLPAIEADSLRLVIYTVPRFPLYKGAGASFGISVDGSRPEVIEYIPKEQSLEWKNNVIRNSMVTDLKVPVDRNAREHTLTITSGTPGLMVQRILVDWGGLKPTYVGPSDPSTAIQTRERKLSKNGTARKNAL